MRKYISKHVLLVSTPVSSQAISLDKKIGAMKSIISI